MQKLLDRFLFILFAEDRGLLPPNSVAEILNQWDKLNDMHASQPLYNRFKLYFGYLNNGHKGKFFDIFAYNGGLFAPDELLDSLTITDNILYNHCRVLAHYDFNTDVDTNILGHIFEHSLNEMDAVEQRHALVDLSKGIEKLDKNKTKRKKDGVFYTPRYIIKYIVESTIGELCQKQKTALGLDNETLIRIDTKKDNKSYQEKIQQYRNWLLQLTILDPTCGSGTFLNQALEFLIEEHRQVDSMTAMLFGDAMLFTDNVTEILEHNIFGVDINEESVEIARLSLWLRTAKVGRKLNDLSRNIKVGNSIISDVTVAGDLAFDWHKSFPQVFQKKEKQAWHITCVMHNTRTSQRMIDYHVKKGVAEWLLPHEEVKLAKIIRDIAIADDLNIVNLNICADHLHFVLIAEDEVKMTRIVGKIKAMSARQFNIWRGITTPRDTTVQTETVQTVQTMGHAPLSHTPDTPDTPDTTTPTRGSTQNALWAQKFNRNLITSYQQLDNTLRYIENNRIKHNLPNNSELYKIVKSFTKDWETTMRPEYKGGFDVVIANTPYGASFNDVEKNYLKKEYQNVYVRTTESFNYFISKILTICNPSAIFGVIIPSSFLNQIEFEKARKLLLDHSNVSKIFNLGDNVFDNDTTPTCIIVADVSKRINKH